MDSDTASSSRGSMEVRRWTLDGRFDVAEAVAPDGSMEFWLVDDDEEGVPVALPRHEMTGRLPQDIRDRLGLICGAPSRMNHGQPCRHRVLHYGEHCPAHREEAAHDRLF